MLLLSNPQIINVFNKQYAVGQGGLHLSLIFYHTNNDINLFAYIYDCGSSSLKKTEFQAIINTLVNDLSKFPPYFTFDEFYFPYCKISLEHIYIFISHLHQDHFNGLPYLKEKLNKLIEEENIDIRPNIIFPYMQDSEKEIIIGLYQEDENIRESAYKNIINSPEDYFNNWDVFYLKGNDGNNEMLTGKKPPEQPCCNNKVSCPAFYDEGNKKIINHKQFFKIGSQDNYWVLRMYYNPISQELLDKIKKAVNSSNNKINEIKDAYKNILGNQHLNNSSICLYSGPSKNIKGEGFLFTGDINLINNSNFYLHYREYIDNVSVIQIPHHGSINNSTLECFRNFCSLSLLFVTKNSKTNGLKFPHLNNDYYNNKFIKQVTENELTSLVFFNMHALDSILYKNLAYNSFMRLLK